MLQRNVFPHPPHVCPAQPTQHKKILLKILSQTATYSSTTYRSPKLCCTTHTTQKNSPQILHSNCYYDVSFARVRAAQPEIPLKISPLKIAGMYHLPEFARHNPRNIKIPLKISSSPKKFPSKILHSNCIVQVRAAQPHKQKNSPQKFWFQLELDGRETSRTGGRNKN